MDLKALKMGSGGDSERWPALRVLAVDNNKISDLRPLRALLSLVEVNAAFNAVRNSDNIYSLSFGPRNLAILSLRGNAVCSELEHWKFYTIFCLQKSLRMLDGESVTASDLEAATNTFSGRLHRDLLLNKLGHGHFGRIQSLDLSRCHLLVLDALCPLNRATFAAIKQLVLSGNQLCDLTNSPILELQTLRDLDLSHNDIGCRSTPSALSTSSRRCGSPPTKSSRCALSIYFPDSAASRRWSWTTTKWALSTPPTFTPTDCPNCSHSLWATTKSADCSLNQMTITMHRSLTLRQHAPSSNASICRTTGCATSTASTAASRISETSTSAITASRTWPPSSRPPLSL